MKISVPELGLTFISNFSRTTLQQALRDAKWPHQGKPTYCFVQLGQKPCTEQWQASFAPCQRANGGLVCTPQQPSTMVSGQLWTPYKGGEVRYSRTTGRPSMGDSVLFVVQSRWNTLRGI